MRVGATFKLRKRRLIHKTQAKASKRRLKPATTSIYKKEIFLTVPELYKREKVSNPFEVEGNWYKGEF